MAVFVALVLAVGLFALLWASGRARNVLGTYPLSRLLAAPPLRTRNLGQRLGLSWLGWRLHDAAENAAKQRAGH
jgi:hypothetical protein